ncbi:DUF982 domain-containing protein [Pararhizobium sp. BT-229]|uniref:DUF982 domain-containing protein n=1 Tax=Pararhizobium sp. BT-229 TaxID=2986923 RepID=UPI0021F78663|nr:DUF982 domain-containing protein [Pararhizobium sp. BT-229]MCV9967795.1 DUF982 domain-containing protein [Pararhizobium sp. BT-229]
MNISWEKPVELQFSDNVRVSVRGPQEALDYLLAIWPTEEGALYMKCKAACMEAIEGVTPVEEARRIFRSAAAEGWDFFVTNRLSQSFLVKLATSPQTA